ncbi:DUF5677 domain-containing protein [Providencia manganoxydans]|uniref:DUF5677 domain-containing protein n=1 Tax=Providencia manganoxydans TaxID=2923283 RepID=UPI0032DB94D6
MTTSYEQFEKEYTNIRALPQNGNEIGFFIQECLRFHSISGTLKNGGFSLDATCSPDERYITHILTRSLLENFFTILYLFDDLTNTADRYDKLKNTFKVDYKKLMTDLQKSPWDSVLTQNSLKLEPIDPNWSLTPTMPNVHDILLQVMNQHGNKLNYLYVIYRISSFDTHGRSLEAILNSVFGKTCNFPVLEGDRIFEVIASEYLAILNNLRQQGLI